MNQSASQFNMSVNGVAYMKVTSSRSLEVPCFSYEDLDSYIICFLVISGGLLA